MEPDDVRRIHIVFKTAGASVIGPFAGTLRRDSRYASSMRRTGRPGLDEHHPAPREMRRSSRTSWPLWRVLLWIGMQLAAVALAILALWLLAR